MFRLALAFVLGLTYPVSTNAQEKKYFYTRQECYPFDQFYSLTTQEWGEDPLFIGEGMTIGKEGQSFTGGAMFLVNQDTGTWTLGTLYADGTVCINAAGTNFAPYSGPVPKRGEKG